MKLIPVKSKDQILYAKVDDDDFEKLSKYKWQLHSDNYAIGWDKKKYGGSGKMVFMHRHIIRPSDGLQVDHVDGDKLNNCKSNLRQCTDTQNKANSVLKKNNSTGHKGVWFDGRRKKYRAYIKKNYRTIHLGYFKTLEEAANAYDQAAIMYFGEYALTNKMIQERIKNANKLAKN
jgi:hypothetical protein